MPDMPQQGAPQGAPAPGGQGGGGGIAEAIAQADALVFKLSQAVAQNPQLSDDIKGAWNDALGALRKAEQVLVQAAGGEPDSDEGGGTTTPEQGGNKGAVPLTHQNMRQ